MTTNDDQHTDLRRALTSAVEAGRIEGWRVREVPGEEQEWIVSMTAEQGRALVVALLLAG